jgi:hypothetical protein
VTNLMISASLTAESLTLFESTAIWCRNIDWGNAPAWVGGVGSLLAFSLALRIYWVNSRDRRMEQARLVSALITSPPQKLTETATTILSLGSDLPAGVAHDGGSHYDVRGSVHLWELRLLNLSKETVSNVHCEIVDSHGSVIVPLRFQDVVAPETDSTFTLVSDAESKNEMGYGVRASFTDASGRHWTRMHGEAVQRLRSR